MTEMSLNWSLEKSAHRDRTELDKEAETEEESFWRDKASLGSGFQEGLLHYLPMDCGEAN